MSKRSTNFTGKKPMKGSAVIDLMCWVGMTEEEIRTALERQQSRQVAEAKAVKEAALALLDAAEERN